MSTRFKKKITFCGKIVNIAQNDIVFYMQNIKKQKYFSVFGKILLTMFYFGFIIKKEVEIYV